MTCKLNNINRIWRQQKIIKVNDLLSSVKKNTLKHRDKSRTLEKVDRSLSKDSIQVCKYRGFTKGNIFNTQEWEGRIRLWLRRCEKASKHLESNSLYRWNSDRRIKMMRRSWSKAPHHESKMAEAVLWDGHLGCYCWIPITWLLTEIASWILKRIDLYSLLAFNQLLQNWWDIASQCGWIVTINPSLKQLFEDKIYSAVDKSVTWCHSNRPAFHLSKTKPKAETHKWAATEGLSKYRHGEKSESDECGPWAPDVRQSLTAKYIHPDIKSRDAHNRYARVAKMSCIVYIHT